MANIERINFTEEPYKNELYSDLKRKKPGTKNMPIFKKVTYSGIELKKVKKIMKNGHDKEFLSSAKKKYSKIQQEKMYLNEMRKLLKKSNDSNLNHENSTLKSEKVNFYSEKRRNKRSRVCIHTESEKNSPTSLKPRIVHIPNPLETFIICDCKRHSNSWNLYSKRKSGNLENIEESQEEKESSRKKMKRYRSSLEIKPFLERSTSRMIERYYSAKCHPLNNTNDQFG